MLRRHAAAIIDAGERELAGGGVDAEEAAAESDYATAMAAFGDLWDLEPAYCWQTIT